MNHGNHGHWPCGWPLTISRLPSRLLVHCVWLAWIFFSTQRTFAKSTAQVEATAGFVEKFRSGCDISQSHVIESRLIITIDTPSYWLVRHTNTMRNIHSENTRIIEPMDGCHRQHRHTQLQSVINISNGRDGMESTSVVSMAMPVVVSCICIDCPCLGTLCVGDITVWAIATPSTNVGNNIFNKEKSSVAEKQLLDSILGRTGMSFCVVTHSHSNSK